MDGYVLDFDYESLDAFQQDAKYQAETAKAFKDLGMPLLMALDKAGVELTDEERQILMDLEKEPEPEPVPPQLEQANETTTNEPQGEPIAEDKPQEEMSLAKATDLQAWQRKAIKRLKESGSAACSFKSTNISDDENANIEETLKECLTNDEIKAVFSGKSEAQPEAPDQIDQIKRAMDWLEAHEVINV